MKKNKIILLIITSLVSINISSQTAEEWKKLGNNELDSTNYEKAIEYYQKAIETDSTYFDAYYNLGLSFFLLQNYDKAIDSYNKAMAINNTESTTYFALGGVYVEKKEYEKAIDIIKKGLDISPNPDEYYNLAFLYQEINKPVYSISYLKKAAQLGNTFAQEYLTDNNLLWEDNFKKPDYDSIKSNIENKQSNLFYDKLWNKFQQGDSTMTLEEKRHLYYGYVFHKNYSPYSIISNSEQIQTLLSQDNLKPKEWNKLVALLNNALEQNPFNLRYLLYLSFAHNALNNADEAQKAKVKIQNVIDAMATTGDGFFKETAIHVIMPSNEYDYLFLNDLYNQMQTLTNDGYDVLSLQPNDIGLEEMWFDVKIPLSHLNKSFDSNKKQ